ncbi:MFS transporter [Acrocarpospora catenulata]|uniref:MFS transporter n=1 Tax=Acrocarpospora catenulata TaxID=2836182 RepID=UPI0027E12D19|nr:MFS transporter [Acrocarpospora catenulata]
MGRVSELFRRHMVDTRPVQILDYRRLLAGQAVGFIGFQLTAVAVSAEVYALTGSSFWVGLLGPVALVPLVVFGLWGGAIADAMDRRRLLLASSVISWSATLTLLVNAVTLKSIWVIMVAVAVQSMGFAVSSPTRNAIVPRLVPVELVPSANTLNFLFSSFSSVLGPLLGGVILAGGGYGTAYLIDAVLFTAALYAAFRLPPLEPQGEVTAPGPRAVADGLRYIMRTPVVLMSFLVDIIAMAFALPRALYPELTAVRFDGSEIAYGWLAAAIPLGAVVGGVFSGWVGRVRRQGVALTLVIAVWGITVAGAGLAESLWLIVLLLAFGGFADLVSAVWRQTILQTYARDSMRGRLQGVFFVVVAGGPRLGDLRAGSTASMFGLVPAWVGGGLVCAVTVVVVGLAVPSFRRYRVRS